MPRTLPPNGAIFNPNAHYYEVLFIMKQGEPLIQPVYAMGIVAAYNIGYASLPEEDKSYILYVKSVTRIDQGE